MDERSIAVLDSGIGGLFTLKRLREKYPKENFIYFSDGKNMPYGEKSEIQLQEIAKCNYKRLLSFGVKAVVFACNTLTVTAEQCFTHGPVPVIGVKPIAEKEGKCLLLCTPKTSESCFVNSLKNDCRLDVLPLKGLAEEIELSFEGKPIDLESRFYNVSRDYDYVSLGCTHYPFLTEKFKEIFPKSRIISGEDAVLNQIENVMTTANPDRKKGYLLFIGEGREKAERIYKRIFQEKI